MDDRESNRGTQMFDPRLIKSVMDTVRPGWRERQARRKSPWNLLCTLVGFILMGVYWYALFQGAWRLHVLVYPEHNGLFKEFWNKGISFRAFASSFLMLMPLFVPAIVVGMLSANFFFWCIPAARRKMEAEADGDREMTFAGSNSGLIRWGGIASLICIVLSIIGLVTLKSLK
jgi:hypothetical protein